MNYILMYDHRRGYRPSHHFTHMLNTKKCTTFYTELIFYVYIAFSSLL